MTPKQARFCEEYLVDLNATQAAIRAGYATTTAEHQASRMLGNVGIQARIAELQAERSRRTRIDADDVLRILYDEARGIGPDTASSARIRAAELLGKNLGMFVDRKIIGIRALPLEQLNEAELAVLAGEESEGAG